MVDEKILEMFNARRDLLKLMLGEIKDFSSHTVIYDNMMCDRSDIVAEMRELTYSINEMCSHDFILLDMYRRLSLSISKEEYEEAILIKNEIINHK